MRLIRNKPPAAPSHPFRPSDFGLRTFGFRDFGFALCHACRVAPRTTPGLHRFAVLTAVATLGLVGIGGLVTSHGAGMAVPDWPNTYGYNMFFFPISQWVGGIFYEHTHRLAASGGRAADGRARPVALRAQRPPVHALGGRWSCCCSGLGQRWRCPGDGRMDWSLGSPAWRCLARAGFGRAASRARNGCGDGARRVLGRGPARGARWIARGPASRTRSASFTPRWRSCSSC